LRHARSLSGTLDLPQVERAIIEALSVQGFAYSPTQFLALHDNGDGHTVTITIKLDAIDTEAVRAAMIPAFAASGVTVARTDIVALVDNHDGTASASVIESAGASAEAITAAASLDSFLASLTSALKVDVTFASPPETARIFVLPSR